MATAGRSIAVAERWAHLPIMYAPDYGRILTKHHPPREAI
jgi:hypothetical protein